MFSITVAQQDEFGLELVINGQDSTEPKIWNLVVAKFKT